MPIDTKARFVSHEPTCLLIRAGRGDQGHRGSYFGSSGNKFRIRGRAQDDDCAYLCRCPTGRCQRLADASPERLLARGYSITLKEGRAVKDASMLQPGDVIVTRLYRGEVRSTLLPQENESV